MGLTPPSFNNIIQQWNPFELLKKRGRNFASCTKPQIWNFMFFMCQEYAWGWILADGQNNSDFFFFFKGLDKEKYISLIFSHDNFFLQFPEYPRFWEKFHICWSLFWAGSKPCSLFQICTHIFPVWVQSGTELTESTVLLLLANIYQIQ